MVPGSKETGNQELAAVKRMSDRILGKRRGRHILTAAGIALAIAAVTVLASTTDPEPAQACLLPGIPC